MNVEIVGTESAQFPEKEYINGICVAVYSKKGKISHHRCASLLGDGGGGEGCGTNCNGNRYTWSSLLFLFHIERSTRAEIPRESLYTR
jgi:hypothetical protein